jgi:FtsP/CotA-like multicopper oxidase with cupredoxin domain
MIGHGTRLEIIVKRMQPPATKRSNGNAAVYWGLASTLVFSALLTLDAKPAFAQGTQEKRTTGCLAPGQIFHNPRELESADGILKGTIVLLDERQGLPESRNYSEVTCVEGVWLRNFRGKKPTGEKLDPMPAQLPHAGVSDPEPGPTLRARVGDLVQLTFVNEVNPNNFDPNIDFKCTEVGKGGELYPNLFNDVFVNCLHASSTANIHFHGTHTNPNSTGDNVYLQVRPLPRDNEGKPTVTREEATAGFAEFFRSCTDELQNPLRSWPATWDDVPKAWTDKQKQLLLAHQQKYPNQRLWDKNQEKLKDDWPIYYIGAFPYCFALPDYASPGGARPKMGQIPGTHWYHAHKHGSTATNVANGMTGAFIIEGKYDADLNAAYRDFYLQKDGEKIRWNARTQPVLVLNQLKTDLNMTSTPTMGNWNTLDFSVNGRIRPKLRMQLGEVQLWRIVNTSSRSAAYFMPPNGLQWRQLAQDGVQLADANYQKSFNQPLYLAPANRADLLVKAPATPLTTKVMIKNIIARNDLALAPDGELLTVEVAGPPVTIIDGKAAEMQLLTKMFDLPEFLNDISDRELELNNTRTRTFTFNSKPLTSPKQHTINGLHFDEGHAEIRVLLDTTEEWKIVNTTSTATGPGAGDRSKTIDHPLHIHINPFQVTELFDPNEKLPDPATGLPGTRPQYVFDERVKRDDDQCFVDPREPSTWKPCAKRKERMQAPWVWHDVFAIPSAWDAVDKDGKPITEIVDGKERQIVIPGYYKMRSRFVDYPGLYVMHCHILIHEDRGMMFSVEVVKAKPREVKHH